MAAGVAGEVHGLDRRAPPRSNTWPSRNPLRIGAGREVELLEHDPRELVARLAREPVDVHQALDRAARPVLVVDVHPGAGEQPVAGDVVLVGVAVDHGVDGTGAPPRATTVTDGSMMTVSASPRTSNELPDG